MKEVFNKFSQYTQVLRLHQPTGFMLLFWPCAWGVVFSPNAAEIRLIALFFVGSVVMRAAGCIINDLFDRNIDIHVERTKNRPIASGKVSIVEALIILAILLIIGLNILLALNNLAIMLGIAAMVLAVIYPLTKRVTFFPQFFLGLAFNSGILIGYAAAEGTLSMYSIILYVAAIFWTLGYDTIYGFQDIEYDKQIGVKSTSIKFEGKAKLFITSVYSVFVGLMLFATYLENEYFPFLSMLFLVILYGQLIWQSLTLKTKSPKSCLIRFKSNVIAGGLVFLAIAYSEQIIS